MIVSENMELFREESYSAVSALLTGENNINSLEGEDVWRENFFILNDWAEFEGFKESAEELLPLGFHITDFSFLYENILIAMGNMMYLNMLILWGGISETLIILSLLILLYLKERKHEIGIYIAMGEKKLNIIGQILLEILTISFIGISLALFSGNVLSGVLSTKILINKLVNSQEEFMHFGEFNPLDTHGFAVPLTQHEMLEAYEVSLDSQAIFNFYVVGGFTIILATAIPVTYLLMLNPRKVLM